MRNVANVNTAERYVTVHTVEYMLGQPQFSSVVFFLLDHQMFVLSVCPFEPWWKGMNLR